MLKRLDKSTPLFVSFLQSLALTGYIFLVANVMINGEKWFDELDKPLIFGPMLFISMFVFSAMVSATVVLGYPLYVFWIKKNVERAAAVLFGTGLFIALYIIIYLAILASN